MDHEGDCASRQLGATNRAASNLLQLGREHFGQAQGEVDKHGRPLAAVGASTNLRSLLLGVLEQELVVADVHAKGGSYPMS